MFPVMLSEAGARVLLAVAQALAPAPDMAISAWVDQGRVILTEKTNTPKTGPFSFDGVEYIREPLDCLHPDHPASRVTVKGSAQSAKSSIGQLWVAWSVANNPKSFAIGLPSDGEVTKYNDYKLQPILEDSPELAPKVRPVSTKSTFGSTARKKKLFNGATLLIFNLGSPMELQMISTGNLILEEVANCLKDVGGRGSPIKQARERQAAYSVIGSKELMVSTPGIKGECEVTKAFDAGDQRCWYGECPHCSGHYPLQRDGFKPASGTWPAHFSCPGCGAALEAKDRGQFIRRGVWLPTFKAVDPESNPAPPAFVVKPDLPRWRARDVEGRQPSFDVWQAMCGFVAWLKIELSIAESKTPEELKTLEQQVFGRAWDPAIEALNWEELHRLREEYEQGIVPVGAGILTGMCDVQGPYLQWAVYAWGPGGEWWVLDRGIITGDTAGDEVWRELDAVTRKTYSHAEGGELAIAAFGIDTGYRTQRAYSFARGRPNCFALDGRPLWKAPFIGKARPARIIENGRVVGRVKLWPTGTWELKSLLAWSLKISTEAGYAARLQGRGHWSRREDEAWAMEMTAEVLMEEKNAKTGDTERLWKKTRKNEETDIWVGARALAWQFGVGAPRRDGKAGEAIDWKTRAAERVTAPPQSELFTPPRAAASDGARAADAGASAPDVAKPARRNWFKGIRG